MEEVTRSNLFLEEDAEIWAKLEQDILPHLISQSHKNHRQIRIWIAECATGTVPILLVLLLTRLLGPLLTQFHLQIFATNHREDDLAHARRGIFKPDALPPQIASEVPSLCELIEDDYCLPPTLRKLLVFGRHDLWHDPIFAHLDLILCGFCLHAYSIERQEHFLSQARVSLSCGGYLVCSRQDTAVVARFPYISASEGLPIYQPLRTARPLKTGAFERYGQTDQKASIAETLHDLLQVAPIKVPSLVEDSSEQQRASTQSTSDVLVQLAPMGIAVLDHHYQILWCNRAAHKLLLLLAHQELPLDFFHATPGLPYQAVRTAIDTVIREGMSQTLAEVELALIEGGNGRILRFEIYALPSEAGSPSQVALYLQDVTLQIVQKKAHLQQVQVVQNLATSNMHLQKEFSDLECSYTHLYEVSSQLLTSYQGLETQLKEMQESYNALEQEVEELRAEIAILAEREDR